MKRFLAILAILAICCTAPLAGELCTIDAVPAATLLLPFFEVDLNDPNGVNTIFSINNAFAEPTVVHVTMWGDYSLPSIDFDIFLTGYDVQTVSLRDLFNGNLPVTAHATNDPEDVISPHGGDLSDNPDWDSAPDGAANPLFPGCNTNIPIVNPIPQAFIDRVRSAHTGGELTPGSDQCVGQNYGDGIARGYITFDNVTDCNLLFPSQPGYFGSGLVNDENQLWGDYAIISEGRAIGDNLVHIEADPQRMAFAPGDYTFYGRYVDGLALDQREPLASTWASRYFDGGAFEGGSDLLVWRDSKCQVNVNGFPCAERPSWYPLDETQVVAFNEAEEAVELCQFQSTQFGISPPLPGVDRQCFPLETQRVRVGEGDLTPPFEAGWLYLNLNFTLGDTSGQTIPCSTDGLFGDIAQSWVTTSLDAEAGQLSVGYAATQLTSACSNVNNIIEGDLGEVD